MSELRFMRGKFIICSISEEKISFNQTVAEFKEFERRFKFKPRLKYGWFHLKFYQYFQCA